MDKKERDFNYRLAQTIRDYWGKPKYEARFRQPTLVVAPISRGGKFYCFEIMSDMKNGFPPKRAHYK